MSHKGFSARAENVNPLTCKRSEPKVEQTQSTRGHSVRCRTVILPSRVPCGSSMELFILFKDEAPGRDTVVEFTGDNQRLTVKPVHWNEWTLCVTAPDFPAGQVTVTVYKRRVPLSKALLQFYNMDEIVNLLSSVEDPVDFMCQALQVPTVDKLNERLSSMSLRGMSSEGFRTLRSLNTPTRGNYADASTVRHSGTQDGWKRIPRLHLQCGDARKVVCKYCGQTSTELAQAQDCGDLCVLKNNDWDDTVVNSEGSVHEKMFTAGNPSREEGQGEQREEGEDGEVEDIYASLRMNDEYSTVNKSARSVVANRPPAPTPRPQSVHVMDNRIPFINQVFMKKTTQDHTDLYSLLAKPAHRRSSTITYDNLAMNKKHVQEQLVDLRKEGLSQLTARVSTDNQSNIYDVAVPSAEPKIQPEGLYAKRQKNFFKKADK